MRNTARNFKLALIRRAKAAPCFDCGVRYPPCVMDFDHVDPGAKSFTVAKLWRGVSTARLVAELAKCQVVCANCHRIRTWTMRGYFRDKARWTRMEANRSRWDVD